MASPSKLLFLVNKIPLNPEDSPTETHKSLMRKYFSPMRFRKTTIRPKRLPKLTTTLKVISDYPSLTELFIKYSATSEQDKIQAILRSTKNKLVVAQNNNIAYIRSSTKRKKEDYFKIRTNQNTPLPSLQGSNGIMNTSPLSQRSNTPMPKMVDATFNTD
ncbi:hypothetical protein SteCoe_33298 [Stentor coeruleus]|uniref:Uncharacterized protein n=1 Tax=Stentor coeruleus TaxID=5963 RepID=A0A1R2AX16_9CILI|nr:hypothetical protein SteCoe_33298 [Stentor coeruleus]